MCVCVCGGGGGGEGGGRSRKREKKKVVNKRRNIKSPCSDIRAEYHSNR